ncbi:hypothetical protein pb186bvf_004894 [Paramecium bursaria]
MDEIFQQSIPFTVLKQDNISYNSTLHYGRNKSIKQSDFTTQNIQLDLGEMANIRFIQIQNLEYGCEVSVFVSEMKSGPYIPIHERKLFPRGKLRPIPLGSVPCRFIKIQINKGVNIQIKQIKLIGTFSEQISEIDNKHFKMLVTNPQRIIY